MRSGSWNPEDYCPICGAAMPLVGDVSWVGKRGRPVERILRSMSATPHHCDQANLRAIDSANSRAENDEMECVDWNVSKTRRLRDGFRMMSDDA